MQTQLFSGTACFSPFVTPTLLRSWAMHGGTVARTYQERRTAQYYFCSGADDPWVARISVQELIVFDAAWIARCVREQFRVAIAPYVLDDGAEEEEQPQQQVKKVHGKRRASERLASSSPAARNPPRAPKRARLGSSPDHGVKSEDSGVPHLDLAAKLERKRRARGGEDDFLHTIYEAEVGPGRFTVDAVLRSLEDVSIAGACVIECGEEHLGRRFRLCC
ncbi:hypothetical protein EDB86DRAFT_3102824 [Lactarius hatsudake]|nr:hypothetical protein EDB86DRAFT_3102824 [Lactarius hatsudake]